MANPRTGTDEFGRPIRRILVGMLVLTIVLHGFAAELPVKNSPPMASIVSDPQPSPPSVRVKSPQHLTIKAVPNNQLANLSPTNDWAKNHWLTNNLPATNR